MNMMMKQIFAGFQSFLAYQSMSGRFSGQQQQTSQQQRGANVNMDLNLGGGGAVRNINIPAGVNNLNLNLQLNNNNNNNNVPLLRATLVQVSLQILKTYAICRDKHYTFFRLPIQMSL